MPRSHQRRSRWRQGVRATPVATAVIVVRYIKKRLLGVTCGRLQGLYERTARLALHRHSNGGDAPFVERFSFDERGSGGSWKNLYALGAGDAELILDVVPLQLDEEANPSKTIVRKLLDELQFEGMVGSENKLLPRLQNL